MAFEHNMMTGKGGEFSVASELLFRDFNANILTVDSGVDIAAIKDGQTYLFQVKTKHWNKRQQIYVDLELFKLDEFTRKNKMFLIIVGRHGNHSNNDYLIFPIKRINSFKKNLIIKPSRRGYDMVRFAFTKLKDGRVTLSSCGDVTNFLGQKGWELIK